MTTPLEAARVFLREHTHHVGLTLMHPLAALIQERERLAFERAREMAAMEVLSSRAVPEVDNNHWFQFRSKVAKRIRALRYDDTQRESGG